MAVFEVDKTPYMLTFYPWDSNSPKVFTYREWIQEPATEKAYEYRLEDKQWYKWFRVEHINNTSHIDRDCISEENVPKEYRAKVLLYV